jgi:hypothetical protein
MLFETVAQVFQDHDLPFDPPVGPSEFDEKHEEIQNRLMQRTLLRGQDVAIGIMERIGQKVQARGGLIGVATEEVLSHLFLEPTNSDARVELNSALHWQAEWKVSSTIRGHNTRVSLEVHSSEWGEVVPKYVVEYVNTALNAYERQMHGPAVVLLAIAVEAVLRDVLEPRGYTYTPGAPSVDIYSYADADVGVDDNSYTVTFRQPMPRSPAQFPHSTGGDPTVEIRVRRVINQRQNRTDLAMIAPPCLIDHWSSDSIQQPAQQRVNGLGEALRIARYEEEVLRPVDLATDLDRIILLARNNLVHLSGQAFDEPLELLDSPGDFTLEDFLNNPTYVHDFVTSVPRFINTQYTELRRAGHLAS